MTCVICTRRIYPETEDFEEVGPIEFAHSRCVEKNETERPQTDQVDKRPPA